MAKKNKKRTDGRVKVSVYLGTDENGKRRYKYFYGSTAKEAEQKAADLRLRLGKGINADTIGDTFEDWSNRWLQSKDGTVSQKTLRVYASCAKYLCEHIGMMPMDKVRPYDIQDVLRALSSRNPVTHKPSSAKLLDDVLRVAKNVFTYAIGNRAVDFNPAQYAEKPKAAPPIQRRALTPEEREWIRTTPHRMQTAAMIMMYTGVRRGELLPLMPKSFDLDACALHVNQFVEMVNNLPTLKDYGKTNTSKRDVHFSRRLADYLRPIFANMSPFAYIVPNRKGGLMSDSAWKSAWESYMRELNFRHGAFVNRPVSRFDPHGIPMVIEPFTAHCLRHTFATIMYEAGVDVLTAKEQLGHASIQTTLGIYTHLQSSHRNKEMDKIEHFFDEEEASCRPAKNCIAK